MANEDRNRTVAGLARDLRAEQERSTRLARDLVEARAEATRLRGIIDRVVQAETWDQVSAALLGEEATRDT